MWEKPVITLREVGLREDWGQRRRTSPISFFPGEGSHWAPTEGIFLTDFVKRRLRLRKLLLLTFFPINAE